MTVIETKQHGPEYRREIITAGLAEIQQRMQIPSITDISFSGLLNRAYSSIKQWEQETSDAQHVLALAREQASETSLQTLTQLTGIIVNAFPPEQIHTLLSVGYGSAKKEEQLLTYLRTVHDRTIAVVGIERDYGLPQNLPPFLAQEPNSAVLLSLDDERPYTQAANIDGSDAVGLMIFAAHHTLLELPDLLPKFQGLNGLMLVEELTTNEAWSDPNYRSWRAAVEIFFNYAFRDEMPKDFDYGTQFDAKYYTREEIEQAGGIITDVPNTTIPPISVVLFPREAIDFYMRD